MRKDDNKRHEILCTAEKLFCTKGYEATSVQDILDVLHASKGGFYHHFASKEEVLKILCQQRAEQAAMRTKERLVSANDSMERINTVLYGFMPLRKEEIQFLAMLLPVMTQPEGRAMAMLYQDAMLSVYQPLLKDVLLTASAEDIIYPVVRSMEGPILHMINRCWLDAMEQVLLCAREGKRLDASVLLGILERYRRSIEVLLDAPYGSIDIVRIDEWDEVSAKLLQTMA